MRSIAIGKQTGVYEIVCLPTGKRYIGSAARSFGLRWNLHKSHLRRGIHHSRYLQRAWDKHGEDAFRFSALIVCRPEDAVFYEQRAVISLNPEFNVAEVRGSGFGREFSAEQKAAISARLRDEWAAGKRAHASKEFASDPEYRRSLRDAAANRSPEVKEAAKARARKQGLANSRKHLVRDEMLTSREISEKYGIKIWTIKRRLECGATGEDLIAPLRPGRRKRSP